MGGKGECNSASNNSCNCNYNNNNSKKRSSYNTSTIYGLKTNLTFIKLPNTHKHNFYAGRTLHVATLHTLLPSSSSALSLSFSRHHFAFNAVNCCSCSCSSCFCCYSYKFYFIPFCCCCCCFLFVRNFLWAATLLLIFMCCSNGRESGKTVGLHSWRAGDAGTAGPTEEGERKVEGTTRLSVCLIDDVGRRVR